ncbi:MAG: PAS domain S-box protein, partial [Ignavibacteria bacterium]|nr:PAS domain S-box protein [Ignavibacteria bacterium]
MITRELLFNLSLLLSASILANLVEISFLSQSRFKRFFIGVLFGLSAILGMMFPYVLQEGLIFDGRSIVLSIVSLFYGPISGIVSGFIALIYRIHVGGIGALVGVITIIISTGVGLLFYYIYNVNQKELKNGVLFLFNFLVNFLVLSSMLLLPSPLNTHTIYKVGFAFIFIYPVVGFVISKVLQVHLEFKESTIKIKDSQEKFSKIFNESTVPLILIDVKTLKITDINDAFLSLTNFSFNDLISKSIEHTGIFDKNDLNDFIISRIKNLNSLSNLEIKIYSKDKEQIDVLVNSSFIHLSVGDFCLCSFFDLRNQKDAIREILRLTRIHSLLSEVNQLIVRTEDADQLLRDICDVCVQEGNFLLVWIGRLERDNKHVTKLFASGSAKEYLNKFEITLDNPELINCQTVQCFLTGRSQIILDWTTDPRVDKIRDWGLKFGIKSSVSLPIKMNGKVLYTINFYSEEKNFFDSPEIALLEEVSNDISYALEAIENEKKRKISEAKLNENVRFLTTLINNLPGFIYRCWNDKNWTMEYITHQVEEITGYKVDDLLYNKNLSFNEIIHPDYQEFLWNKWQDILPKREVFEFEYPIITKSGEIKWVWERGRGVYDENGNVICLEGFIMDVTDKVLFRQKLVENTEKLKLLVEGTPYFFFYTHDVDGRITYISPSVERITGYIVEDWLGNRNWYLTENPINERAKENTRKVLRGELGEYPIYIEIYHRNGEKIILEIYEVPHYKDNKIIGLHGIARDVTIEKKYQEKLRRSEERFRKLFEEHSAVKLIIDPSTGQIIDANNSALRFYGYTLEELKSMKISDINILTPQEIKEAMQMALKGEKNYFEFKHKLKDGRIRDVAVFSSDIELEGKTYLHSIIHDITEAKRLEKDLQFEKSKFQQLFDNSPLPIAVIDGKEKIQIVNQQFVRFFHLGKNEEIGKNFIDLFTFDELEKIHQNFLSLVLKGDKRILETYIKKHDGSVAYVQMIGVPIFLNFEIIGAFVVIIDLTKIKEAEENLKAAKEVAELASKVKDTFIANISHEIRTPLNAILGYTSLIKETTEHLVSDDEKFYFEVIESAGSRLMRTIDMIMNYSRIVAGDLPLNKEKLNLTKIIQVLCDEFNYTAQLKQLDFEFTNECGEVFVFGDNYCITQAIANVIDNAIKYTKKGSIKVRLKRDTGNKPILEVIDTGIGISEEYKDKIFEPYTQQELGWNRPYEGVGLGLALVKKYLNLNGMDVTFISEEG